MLALGDRRLFLWLDFSLFVNNYIMAYYFPCGNGISCFDRGKKTIAVVSSDGNKKVKHFESKNKIIFANFFFLRGIFYFFCGIFALFNTFNMSDQISGFEESRLEKTISKRFYVSARYLFILFAIIFAFLLSYLLLGLVPAKLSFLIMGSSPNLQLRAFVIALLKVATIFLLLLLLRFLPPVQTFFRFNAATNTIDSAKTYHRPLNFVNFLVFTFLFCVFMVSLIAVNINAWANLLVNLAIVILGIGFCYELLNLLEKFKGKWPYKLCLISSWFVCVKPKVTQGEIAKVIKLESQFKDSVDAQDGVPISALITEMQTKLDATGRNEKSDIDWIIATVLGKNRAEIKLVRAVNAKQYREIMSLTERRAKGEPLSNIFGFVDFYGIRLDVNKKVLTPRPETEILVEEALKLIKDGKKREVCDLCTGSGAIAIAISLNANVKMTAIDISKQALINAQANAKKNGAKIDFIESDLFEKLKKFKKFDIILSNPPYIESKAIDKLDIEVKKYDPRLALDGGDDGLDFYRRISADAPKHLTKNGILMFEIGKGQAAQVRKILKDNGFIETKVVKDYSKIERVIYGKVGT